MDVIYNNVFYNTRTQENLEELLNRCFAEGTREQFSKVVHWYQIYISSLIQILNSHKLSLKTLLKDSMSFNGNLMAQVEFILYIKDERYYAYIHNLSFIKYPLFSL